MSFIIEILLFFLIKRINHIEAFLRSLDNYSNLIAAIAVVLALAFSVFVHIKTRNLLIPTERPIISLYETGVLSERKIDIESGFQVETKIEFNFKNIGKHPAMNIRIKIGTARKTKPDRFENLVDNTFVNKVNPDYVFSSITPIFFTYSGRGDIPEDSKHFYIYLILEYKNWLKPKKPFYDEYWYSYSIGEKKPHFLTIKDKEILEPYITKLYPERINIK